MAVRIQYQSNEETRGQDRQTTSITYYGPEQELKAFAASLKIGSTLTGISGAISSIRVAQDVGDIWICEVGAEINYDDDGNPSDPTTATGPNSQRLSGSRLGLALEDHPKYHASWNHKLIANINTVPVPVVPSWYLNATDTTIPDSDKEKYRWVGPKEEYPSDWYTICNIDPRFKGVTGFDWSTYTITETGKHSNKNKAGWVTAEALNSIVAEPELGDFGLTAKLGGDWKVDDVDVYYDGKYWIANRVYAMSGDANGWNKVLYGDEDPTNPDQRGE